MFGFIDKVPTYKGRKTITYEDGTTETVTIENADEPIINGTPINREAMMALQGFIANTTDVSEDGTITQTNSKGEILTITPFDINGISTKTFKGEKTIVLKTILNEDGTISEVLE